MAYLGRFYRFSQIPAGLFIGYVIRDDFIDKNQPEFICNLSGVTIGILGSFVWPILMGAYGYVNYENYERNKIV